MCLPVINKEVDFIATNAEEKRYIQATESMNKPTTRERELAPPRIIRDNYALLLCPLLWCMGLLKPPQDENRRRLYLGVLSQ